MMDATYDVVGIGRAFTDVVADIDTAFLKANGLRPGIGTEVTARELTDIRAQFGQYMLLPGGSPSNTAAGIAALGGKAAFLGKVCDDATGRAFASAFRGAGVFFPNPVHPPGPGAISATCLVLASPDEQVTMAYCRGVADRLTRDDMFPDILAASRVVLFQAHLFTSPESQDAVRFAVTTTETARRKVAISLSDFHAKPGDDTSFLAHADFLFSNLSEFGAAFPGKSPADMRQGDTIHIVTRGGEGAEIAGRGNLIHVPPLALVPDTRAAIPSHVGAGDQFAAGFLFGHARDLPLAECGSLGAETAGAILRANGGRPRGDWRGFPAKYLPGMKGPA